MLEALKEIDLLELIERQKMLDDKFNEKNKNNENLKKRNKINTLIAFELCGIEFSSLYVRGLFNAITSILYEIDSNWIEFLEVHHKKFELNYYKRTKEDY
jgi:hypothetical protein